MRGALNGELRYDFTPSAASSCDDLLSGDALADEMPCSIVYAFDGEVLSRVLA